MRIAIAQLNPIVGDFTGNLAKVEATLESTASDNPELVVFPEMFVTGYPPQDLLEKPWFLDAAEAALDRIVSLTERFPDTGVLIGTLSRVKGEPGKGLMNSAVLAGGGRELARTHKSLLPAYDVFDETRYFDEADGTQVVDFAGERLGISICEDAWNDPSVWRRPVYDFDPIERQAEAGATLLINISASPFSVGKDATRYRLYTGHAKRHGLTMVVVNQVGGNDELVFDGRSMCVTPEGSLIAYLPAFEESVLVVDTADRGKVSFEPDDEVASIYEALRLGLSDYVGKCGFRRVAVGLSGGVDSAVVAAIAADAVGPENVTGITMPSVYSSAGSVDDSLALGRNLGIRVETVPIAEVHEAYRMSLSVLFPCGDVDVTQENVQARIRGNILMALSNKEGSLVLSTGNKSELAVGYCTLYGDMSGGLAVISDVPKTTVYDLARHINRNGERIPQATIDKPPSAELRPDQTDQDTLPPYDVLDRILAMYVDDDRSVAEIVDKGFEEATVRWIVGAVNGNEYKRRQAAPGLKVTSKAFGSGRRMPIAARYETRATHKETT